MLLRHRLRLFAPLLAVVSFGVYMAATGLTMPGAISPDSWYDLVAGRLIYHHGLPHHDHLALMSYNDRWTDQQWLAQLVYYLCDRAGGLHLVAALHLLLYSGGIALAVAAGYTASSSVGRTAIAAAIAPLVLRGWWAIPRAQDFSVALFGLFLYLIVRDQKRQDKLILLTLPLLIVWANLHGACLIGSLVVAFYGLCLLRRRRWIGAVLLFAPLTVIATPYLPADLLGYYHHTLLNPAIQDHVSEWRPPSLHSDPLIFVTGAAVIFAVIAFRRRLSLFAGVMIVGSLLAVLDAQRNVHWYAMTAAALVPPLLPTYSFPEGLRSFGRKASDLSLVLVVVAVGFVGAAIVRPDAAIPSRLAGQVGKGPVLADGMSADWLLWLRPDEAGHVAYDIRWELLPTKAIDQIASTVNGDPKGKKFIDMHRWVLVSAPDSEPLVRSVQRTHQFKLVSQQGGELLFEHK